MNLKENWLFALFIVAAIFGIVYSVYAKIEVWHTCRAAHSWFTCFMALSGK